MFVDIFKHFMMFDIMSRIFYLSKKDYFSSYFNTDMTATVLFFSFIVDTITEVPRVLKGN